MPIYVYECECGNNYEVLEFGEEINKPHKCNKCSKDMERTFCPVSTFILKYDPKKDKVSWGAEGYARSQYWDAVNAQKWKEE